MAKAKTKQCAACGETKNASEFHGHNYAADGLRSRCKACGPGAPTKRKRRDTARVTNEALELATLQALVTAAGGPVMVSVYDGRLVVAVVL